MSPAEKNGGAAVLEAPGQLDASVTATGDPVPPVANPLVLNDAYYELNGVNLRCLVKHIELKAENKLQSVVSLCGEFNVVGTTIYHQTMTFHQTFDIGATYATLNQALQQYLTGGTPSTFKVRPHASLVASANNPIISGQVIPQPFDILVGDAGVLSEVAITWDLTAPWTVNTGAIVATGATGGFPGFYSPAGATVPANLAALTGITATPATAWPTGQYVITADLVGAHWSGSAWVVGKA
jgi:hypothetical protein